MKLGSATKPNKRNKTRTKKFEGDIMSENFDVFDIFLIYGKCLAIWKPDSGHIV